VSGNEGLHLSADCGSEESSQASPALTRMRAAVKEAVVELHNSRFKMTVSVGVAFAHWPHHARTPGELIQAADTHLYQAKKGGRDRCRLEEELRRAA
jgi:diguanylate cyclase (GGDEF)-like protein